MKSALALAPVILLVACASAPEPGKPGDDQRIAQAATTPLSDLNVVRAEIPPALKAAAKNPYGAPTGQDCTSLAHEVAALDAELGADLDMPETAKSAGLVDRGGSAVGDAGLDALQSAAEGVVPFRGWIRKLSGAERNSKEVSAAVAAGAVRRAFLKGLGSAHGCEAPAAPLQPASAPKP
ncbi:MAG: hypothetical protein JO006_05155 [Paucibacter sp.]|nr:hypothetical protein [Roseateles sp.]